MQILARLAEWVMQVLAGDQLRVDGSRKKFNKGALKLLAAAAQQQVLVGTPLPMILSDCRAS